MAPRDPAPQTAAEALARAREHARRATHEAICAVRALLDAAALGWSGQPAEAHAALRGLGELLEQQAARFGEDGAGVPASVMKTLLEALDLEIARWEERAASDPDARAVLRTFLGLREILWELGMRRSDPTAESAKESARARPTRRKSTRRGRGAPGTRGATADPAGPGRRSRVQRVDVKG